MPIFMLCWNRLGNPEWGKEYLVNFLDEPWFVNAHKNGMFNTNRYTEKYGELPGGLYRRSLEAFLCQFGS
jgi:hypothetical protein